MYTLGSGFIELIDTLWNVNQYEKLTRIKKVDELIDTLWNVNVSFVSYFISGFFELIDTLWNVNGDMFLIKIIGRLELIDTLWNVNTIPSQTSGQTALKKQMQIRNLLV